MTKTHIVVQISASKGLNVLQWYITYLSIILFGNPHDLIAQDRDRE